MTDPVARRNTPTPGSDLLGSDPASDALRPLAERMRPQTLDEMVGQRRLLAPAPPCGGRWKPAGCTR